MIFTEQKYDLLNTNTFLLRTNSFFTEYKSELLNANLNY